MFIYKQIWHVCVKFLFSIWYSFYLCLFSVRFLFFVYLFFIFILFLFFWCGLNDNFRLIFMNFDVYDLFCMFALNCFYCVDLFACFYSFWILSATKLLFIIVISACYPFQFHAFSNLSCWSQYAMVQDFPPDDWFYDLRFSQYGIQMCVRWYFSWFAIYFPVYFIVFFSPRLSFV